MPTRDYGSEYEFQPGAQCNIRQYRMLVHCASSGDVTEWNERRRGRPDEEVWLCGVDFAKMRLNKVNFGNAHLEGCVLAGAALEDAIFYDAHLDGAVLWQAHLEGANFWQARMRGAKLWRAHMQKAALLHADLEGASLRETDLQRADLSNANLQGAELAHARLQGAKLNNARLQGTDFQYALVDGATRIADCEVDRDTDFTGVGLDGSRVEPGLSQLLKYNIRRKRWREWYGTGPRWLQVCKRVFVGSFWWASDYGQSTVRILGTFTILAVAFAALYFCVPGLVRNLSEAGGFTKAVHALYFSVVVMTTLGFGDVHANPDVWPGQVVLIAHVLLGYVLLGALLTRLSVLFTAGGPSASFTKRSKNTTGKTPAATGQ